MSVKFDLPFLTDPLTVHRDLNSIAELCELAHEAIRGHRISNLSGLGEVDHGGLERLQTQSSLMMAHSTFEFALKQWIEIVEDCADTQKNSKREKSLLETLAARLQVVKGQLPLLDSCEWKLIVTLAKVRNLIAHATGFQDRGFDDQELNCLAKVGIRHAVAVDPSDLGAFVFEPRSVKLCVEVYSVFLSRMWDEIEIGVVEC